MSLQSHDEETNTRTYSDTQTYLFKESLCLVQDVLQLNQVQQVLLERLLVGIDLLHLALQHLKLALKINHVCTWDTIRTGTGP